MFAEETIPKYGGPICKALHLRQWCLLSRTLFLISETGLWWEGKQQHLWYEWGTTD